MPDNPSTPTSVPSLPVDDILVKLADSLAQAQQALDQASLRSEMEIHQAGLDRQFGMSAKWYAIPELTFDVKLAFEIGDKGEVTTQMVDAAYQNKYGFNLKASSLLQTRIVATPAAEGQGLHLMDAADVLRRIGTVKRVVMASARAAAPHFVAVYRPFSPQGYSGGLWYALLLDALAGGGQHLSALVVVSDQDGQIVRLWTDDEPRAGDTSPAGGGPVTVEGVAFTGPDARAALQVVNSASEAELRDILGLRATAVTAILAGRPFPSLAAVAELPDFSAVSLRNLLDHVKE